MIKNLNKSDLQRKEITLNKGDLRAFLHIP